MTEIISGCLDELKSLNMSCIWVDRDMPSDDLCNITSFYAFEAANIVLPWLCYPLYHTNVHVTGSNRINCCICMIFYHITLLISRYPQRYYSEKKAGESETEKQQL